LVLLKRQHFFAEKKEKIAENCDHNIDPWAPAQFMYAVHRTYVHAYIRCRIERFLFFSGESATKRTQKNETKVIQAQKSCGAMYVTLPKSELPNDKMSKFNL
jgi:hypothetical protein